jgi:hypothetical protein
MTSQQLSQSIKVVRPTLAYDDKQTVKLDFDGTPLKTVKFWCFRTMQFFKLQGFIILQSSKNNYHAVFDRSVSWSRNLHIIAWVAQQSKHKKLTGWLLFQCIKESSTLRVGRKGRKGVPKIVFRYGTQNNEIKTFLQYRKSLIRLEERFRK